MDRNLKLDYINLPNFLTGIRFILIPVMWVYALSGNGIIVGIGLAISAITDILDGYLSRLFGQQSKFGSKFDSYADTIITISAIIWLTLLEPALFDDYLIPMLVVVTLFMAHIIVGLMKFNRFANLHLYSSKASAILQYVFLVSTFILDGYIEWLFFLTIGVAIISFIETLILQITLSKVDEHMKSVIHVYLKKRTGNNVVSD